MAAKHTLTVLVNNHIGVLSRVAGLFSRRGFSIDSLNVGTTEDKDVSRMTIVIECEDEVFSQIKNQLAKLMDVVGIFECEDSKSVKRELALVKIDAEGENRTKILEIANIFRCHIIDVTPVSLILEATGDAPKITALIGMLKEFGIKEVIRSGVTAIARGDSEFKKIEF